MSGTQPSTPASLLDARERIPDLIEALRTMMDGRQASIWTALPGVIVDVSRYASEGTVVVQPTIQAVQQAITGDIINVNLPLIPDVPVHFLRGGGYTMTYPIAVNDECILVFSSRCIDNWWAQGGVQPQFEKRMHDLSDAFALVGVMSKPHVLPAISTTNAQFRSDDGNIMVELNSGGGIARVKAPTRVIIDAPIMEVTGVLQIDNTGALGAAGTVNGQLNVTGQVFGGFGTLDQVGLTTHEHSGSGSGPPIPGT